MLYLKYEIIYYCKKGSLKPPIPEYLYLLPEKERAKIMAYIEFLRQHEGRLLEPYAKHIYQKIWELRIGFGKNRHRIFYFIAPGKKIVLLSAFLKHTQKTPYSEINKAHQNFINYINLL